MPPWQDSLRHPYPLRIPGFLGKKIHFPDFSETGAYRNVGLEWETTLTMEQNLETAFSIPDLEIVILRAELYADTIMRRYIWRGLKARVGANKQLLVNGKSADDFVKEAVQAFFNGKRNYRFDMDLETNLKRTIESMIWTWKKKSDKQPLVDHRGMDSESGMEFDPLSHAVDPEPSGLTAIEQSEQRELQRVFFEDFKTHLKDDPDLSELLSAYEAEITKPAEIEELTGIVVSRVSELKRKLRDKAAQFMSEHPSAEALENYGTNQKTK